MASTYTDIGTELMVTGENAGTWGTKTNTNIQILEEAIRGYVAQSIAGSAQTTALTYSDGATGDSARNAVIALTGTITGNQVVTVTAKEKWWIIDNQTSGAYTVQVLVSGQTGVTWGTSDKGTKILYCNGTDVVDTNIGGVGAYDLNGAELTLDADADTSITASTDDQIDFEIAGADDFTMTANAFNVLTGSHATFADSANAKFGTGNDMLMYHDGSNSYITNAVGALKIATETSGIAVTIGHTTSETTIADNLTVTGTLTGTLATAAQGTVTSLGTLTTLTVDNVITNGTTIGHTDDTDLMTLADGVLTVAGELDATTLDISGNADIDGTTNLDAVDIDGAVQVDATITVGADDQGYDVKFFGDTASAYMLWDTSTDDLVLAGAAGIDLAGDIDVDGTANLDAVDIDGAVQIDGAVTVGVDDTGVDVKFFGATSGSFMLWDESDDALELTDSSPIKIGDGGDMQVYHDGSNSYITNSTGALKLATETSGIAITLGHSTSEVTVADNLTITGDLTVNGTTTTVNSTTVTIDDPIFTLGGDSAPGSDDNKDRGIEFRYHDGSNARIGFMGYDDSATGFTFLTAATNSSEVFSGTAAKLIAGELDISGDADIDGTLEADAITINGTAIGSIYGVVAGSSSIVTTGALDSGSITSGFGTIDTGSSTITTTGLITGGSLDIDDVLINGTTIGHTDDTDLITLADGIATVAGEISVTTLDIGGTNVTTTAAEINLIDGGTARGTTAVADADGILHNDGGTMRMTSAATFKTYFTSGVSSAADDITVGDAAVTIGNGSTSADITIDSGDDVVIDAAGGNIEFKDAGTLQLSLDMDGTAGVQIIKLGVDSDDLVFQQYDGNEVMRINDDRKLYFYDDGGEHISSDGTDFTFASGNDINLTATTDINVPANVGMTFGNDGEKIEGDGTDLTISGNNINLTATADVVIPANVGITFGSGEKIEGDSTDLTVTSGAKINLTATSDVHIPNDVGIVFGGDSEKIEGDGTDLTISANNLTIDCAADLVLDAAGNNITLKSGGTALLDFVNSSSDVVIKPMVDAKDIIFQQYDGTEVARIEDNATFNVSSAGKFAYAGTAVTSTAAELNIVDGGTSATATTVVDADRVVLNDNGTMVQVAVTDIKTYIGGGTSWQAVKTGDFTAAAGQGVFCNTTSAAFTLTLPAGEIGDEVSFIDYARTFDSNNLTIAANGSEKIHGSTDDLTVSVEGAANTLVFTDSTQGWLLKSK